jgi:peptidoglycan/LPS O-acetylase OafA/YrhL
MAEHYSALRLAITSRVMLRRTPLAAIATLAVLLESAAPAFASHAGEGWAGELNDKVITFFSLGVLLFFVLVIVVFSWIQGRLEKRKDEAKAAKALARTGW